MTAYYLYLSRKMTAKPVPQNEYPIPVPRYEFCRNQSEN